MLLNRFEKALMNNAVRAAVQRRVEARWLLALGGRMPGGKALEVGCGRGVGCEIVLDRFGADAVDGFDLDADMVARARSRLCARGDRVRLWVGDAEHIAAPDARYAAVFDFGIVHHVPDWRAALGEIYRVLEPGGRFYAEEVLADFLSHRLVRRLFDHPEHDRFDHATFVEALGATGFTLRGSRRLLGGFGWYVADKPA